MNLPEISVRRPIFTTMVTLIVVIIGAVSLSRLQIDMLPDIEMPSLTIRTEYEGAGPEVMERLVTQIIEEIVATVPGVEEIMSTSSEGNSSVRVSFVWGTKIDAAAIDVQGMLEDEINELPEDIVRPRVRKFDIASFPVVILGISSNLDPVELTELIDVQIRYRFARIPGVAQVDTWGAFNREVRIELDPDRVKALGLSMDRVIAAIKDANLDLPTGKIEQGRYEVTLRAPAEFTSLDQIRDTVIVRRDGAAVTLDQIAEVKDTYEKLTRMTRVNGQQGIRVAIRKQANANTVEVAKRVLAEIKAANEAYPQIHIVPVINQGKLHRTLHQKRGPFGPLRRRPGHFGASLFPAQFEKHRGHFPLHPHFHRRHLCPHVLRRFYHQPHDPRGAGAGGRYDGGQLHRGAGKYLPPKL